jgi:hypothetical protein
MHRLPHGHKLVAQKLHLNTPMHDHNSNSSMQTTEAEEHLHCDHLLLKYRPVHFQWRMHSRRYSLHDTNFDRKSRRGAASSEVGITGLNAAPCRPPEEHVEVFIDNEMLSELPLLATMFDSSEEDPALADADCANAVDDTEADPPVMVHESSPPLLHDNEKVEGDPLLAYCTIYPCLSQLVHCHEMQFFLKTSIEHVS